VVKHVLGEQKMDVRTRDNETGKDVVEYQWYRPDGCL